MLVVVVVVGVDVVVVVELDVVVVVVLPGTVVVVVGTEVVDVVGGVLLDGMLIGNVSGLRPPHESICAPGVQFTIAVDVGPE